MTVHEIQVLRVFGHNDGYGTTMPVQNPIQPRPGLFSEVALRRFDFVMNALAEVCCALIASWMHSHSCAPVSVPVKALHFALSGHIFFAVQPTCSVRTH